MAWDRLVSAGRKLVILGFWRAEQLAPTFVLHFSLQGYRKPVSMFTTCLLPAGKRMERIRPVARTACSRRRISGRAMELVNGHESFLSLSNRGALSILDTSFKFTRASYLASGNHGQL